MILSKVEKAFCAGANIKDFINLDLEKQAYDDIFKEIRLLFLNIEKPLICGINGLALGGGFELALTADIIICAENAKLGLPELSLGVLPGLGGTQRLTKIIGKILSSYYIYTGERINAEKAKELRLCSHVVSNKELHKFCIDIAIKISQNSLTTLIKTKDCIVNSEELGITDGMKLEKRNIDLLMSSKAKKEGVDAFLNKRKANFDNI